MSNSAEIQPVEVRAPHGAPSLTIRWADGNVSTLPHSVLRGYCPCATCQGHSGIIGYRSGGSLDLTKIERIGNYALGFTWGDGHSGGLYGFDYLRRLGDLVAKHGEEGTISLSTLSRG